MKVELLVNLKVGTGKIISAGSVYSDEEGTPIPEFVMRRLQRRQARILPGSNKPAIVAQKVPSELLPKAKKEKAVSTFADRKAVAKKEIGKKTIGKKGM